MRKDKVLKKKWAKYYEEAKHKYHTKSQSIKKEIAQLEYESREYVERHEYTDAENKNEDRKIAQMRLEECLPMCYEAYILKEFEKEFNMSTKGYVLTDNERLFFRIYYYREYLGWMIMEIQEKLGIDHNRYYRIYHMGKERFFSEDAAEELSEVG